MGSDSEGFDSLSKSNTSLRKFNFRSTWSGIVKTTKHLTEEGLVHFGAGLLALPFGFPWCTESLHCSSRRELPQGCAVDHNAPNLRSRMKNSNIPWLEDEQEDLLKSLVSAHLKVARAERKDFLYTPSIVRTQGASPRQKLEEIILRGESVLYRGTIMKSIDELPPNWEADLVYHDGLDGGVVTVLTGDLDALKLQDLLYFRDDTHFSITPQGFRYAETIS